MQERGKIQQQLKQMREDCVKDYLETKLESIASKQVVNDILMGFLESNNQEFLESVTQSILQAKENSRRLKESIEVLKKEQESAVKKERERVKEECQQEHLKEMSKLRQEIGLIKNNLQFEESEYAGRIQQAKQQLRVSEGISKQLREHLQFSQAKNSEMAARIAQLSMNLEQNMKQTAEYNQINNQLKDQAVEQRRKHEIETNSIKNMHIVKEKQLRKQLQQQNSKAVNEQRHIYQEKISNIQQKLKWQESQRIRQQEQAKRLYSQLQKCRIIINQVNSKIELLQSNLAKNQRLLEQKQTQINLLQEQISNKQQQNIFNLQKVASLQRRNAQAYINHNQTSFQLKDKITLFQKQKELASMAKRYLEDQLEKQASQHTLIIHRYQKEIQELKVNLGLEVQERKACQQRLEQQIEARMTSQEEVSTLLKYNAIHQLQAQKCASELRRIEEECRAQVSTYQQAFQMNMQEIEQQLASQKEENAKLRSQIMEIQRQIELQQQQEKYYHGYLEEIAFLKSQLKEYQTECRKALSFKQVQQLTKRLDTCYKENRKLKQFIGEQLRCFQQDFNQAFNLIVSAVQQSSLKCLYCRHQKEQLKMVKSPYNKIPEMGKTVPRSGMQKQTMASMKRNLKSIQQKYQMAYSQNQSFTNRIDSYLNNS